MIPNQWYAVLDSKEVRSGKPTGVKRLGERLVLWRDAAGQVVCQTEGCPHRGTALSLGTVRDGCIECPFHGFQFDTTGRCRLIPANGRSAKPGQAFNLRTLPVQEKHGFIYLWTGPGLPTDLEAPFFESIDASFSYGTLRDPWPVHYTRAIENQLDVVHLPFVHKTTIGRGNRSLINGPLTEWDCQPGQSDLLNIWVANQVDRGQTPLRETDLPQPNRRPFLQFRFPNVWHNWISDDLRIVAAFAPVDDENTMLYVRMYQRILRLPIARSLFNWIGKWGNLVILNQDKRVVITQVPKRSDLRMGEKLIPGDGPIIAYRRRRSDLMAASPGEKLDQP